MGLKNRGRKNCAGIELCGNSKPLGIKTKEWESVKCKQQRLMSNEKHRKQYT
jgi:hypothetical protein